MNKIKTWVRENKFKTGIILAIVFLLVGFWTLYAVNQFFETYQFKFQSPVQKPIWIEKRPVVVHKAIVPEAKAAPAYSNPIEQMVFEKFGAQGDLAVAISWAENGTRQCDRIAVEPDGTVSVGLWQINSRHFKRFPLKDLVDCEKNNEAAYTLYTEWKGFGAWSAFKNGSYKKYVR